MVCWDWMLGLFKYCHIKFEKSIIHTYSSQPKTTYKVKLKCLYKAVVSVCPGVFLLHPSSPFLSIRRSWGDNLFSSSCSGTVYCGQKAKYVGVSSTSGTFMSQGLLFIKSTRFQIFKLLFWYMKVLETLRRVNNVKEY